MSNQISSQKVFTERQVVVIQPLSSRFDQQQGVELLNNIGMYASANALVNTGSDTNLLIDMSNIDFLDSSGLSILLSALKAANEQGSNLALCSLHYPVRLIFEITRMDQRFAIFDTYEDYKNYIEFGRVSQKELSIAKS